MANVHDLEEDSLDKYEHGPEVTNDHNDDKLSEQLELEMALPLPGLKKPRSGVIKEEVTWPCPT